MLRPFKKAAPRWKESRSAWLGLDDPGLTFGLSAQARVFNRFRGCSGTGSNPSFAARQPLGSRESLLSKAMVLDLRHIAKTAEAKVGPRRAAGFPPRPAPKKVASGTP